jgi:site-specific recombinase XerD
VLLLGNSNTVSKKGQRPPNYGRTFPPEILTEDEIAAILHGCSQKSATGIRNRAMITVMYRCGLRISEVLALRLADIDAARGTIRVLHGKGDKARTVGIDQGALAVLQRWIDTRRRHGFRNGPLFCTLQAGPVSDRYVRDMLKRCRKRAGLEKRIHPHGLRHTHAAELSDEGVPLAAIRDQLGHETLATTDRYLRGIAPAHVIAIGRSRPWSEPSGS